MNIFRKIFGRLSCSVDKHDVELYRARLDLKALRLHEEARRMEMHKCYAQRKEEREQKSGIVIDPGGTCLCRMCGHAVSAMYDHCDNCNAKIDWNA